MKEKLIKLLNSNVCLMKLLKCLLLVAWCLCLTLIKEPKERGKQNKGAGASHQVNGLGNEVFPN